MRSFPIDSNRVRLISTGNVSPVAAWVVLADGSRRPDPNGRQDLHTDGRPLWTVEVIVPADDADERDRTEVVPVTVASHERPDGGTFGDVLSFAGLTVQPGYVNRRTNQLTTPRWSADGVAPARNGRPAPVGGAS
jgi:hypothetical protein